MREWSSGGLAGCWFDLPTLRSWSFSQLISMNGRHQWTGVASLLLWTCFDGCLKQNQKQKSPWSCCFVFERTFARCMIQDGVWCNTIDAKTNVVQEIQCPMKRAEAYTCIALRSCILYPWWILMDQATSHLDTIWSLWKWQALVTDRWMIAKKYLFGFFFVDAPWVATKIAGRSFQILVHITWLIHAPKRTWKDLSEWEDRSWWILLILIPQGDLRFSRRAFGDAHRVPWVKICGEMVLFFQWQVWWVWCVCPFLAGHEASWISIIFIWNQGS